MKYYIVLFVTVPLQYVLYRTIRSIWRTNEIFLTKNKKGNAKHRQKQRE